MLSNILLTRENPHQSGPFSNDTYLFKPAKGSQVQILSTRLGSDKGKQSDNIPRFSESDYHTLTPKHMD